MTTRASVLAAGLVLVAGVACEDPLTAKNLNNPDVIRVFQQPVSIEQALGSGYQLCRNTEKNTSVGAQLAVMAGESYSALNNDNRGPRGGIPRAPILNNKSSAQAEAGTFSAWSRQGRLQANALKQLDALRKANGRALTTDAADLRARALGFFNMACNLGWLSLVYDSGAVIDHIMPSDSVPPLSPYAQVNSQALAFLDSAVAVAGSSAASGTGGFPATAAWFGGNALTAGDFVKLARSYRAKFRAAVGRSKAERNAVNWTAVAADAEAGLTADFIVTVGGATGWSGGFQAADYFLSAARAQMTLMYNGFSDVGTGYRTWLTQSLTAKVGDFAVITPDRRWPQGATVAAQRAASPEPSNHTQFPYIAARADWSPGDPWGESWYSHHRWKFIRNNSGTGPWPEFLKAEVDMLAAEAYLRTGDLTKALGKINPWRARAGLPPIPSTVTSPNDLLPGPDCVPQVPAPPNYTTTQCGSIFEAMKYEWRMELQYNHTGAWFFAGRGWEDLPFNTPLTYPVPVEELDARYGPRAVYYNTGGGGYASSPQGTYRF